MQIRLAARSFHNSARWLAVVAALLWGAATAAFAQNEAPVGAEGFAILAQLFTYDAALPLNARTIERFDTATFTREKFLFDGWRGSRVTGLLAMPKSGAEKHPVIVLIDGIGGWKERWWQRTSWNRGRVLIDSLIAGGFAVAMIDAPGSGERRYEADFVNVESYVSNLPLLRELALQNTIEHRRLIDYLSGRTDVDTARLGMLGLSLGGMTTFFLGAFEPRIAAAVAGVTPLHRVGTLLWPGHYAAHLKLPLLMLMGRRDAFYTEEQVGRVFGGVGSKDKKLVWYDVGHRLPEEYAAAAAAWFRAYLR